MSVIDNIGVPLASDRSVLSCLMYLAWASFDPFINSCSGPIVCLTSLALVLPHEAAINAACLAEAKCMKLLKSFRRSRDLLEVRR